MSRNNVDIIRIPVGYWIISGDQPYVKAIDKLDWAVEMAKKYNILVLICLHGAPGSQNGNDHSGRVGSAKWYEQPKARAKTTEVLKQLAERYSHEDTVWGIELLNEPLVKIWQKILRDFYTKSYDAIRKVGRKELVVVFSDAFTPRLLSGALRAYRDFPVHLDHHWYHFFIPGWLQSRLSFKWYYRYLDMKLKMLQRLHRDQPIIIGEWNGIIGGEKLNQFPKATHDSIVDEHIKRQLDVYNHIAAWFYWSYKTDERGVFHFRSMVEDGHLDMSR